MIGDLCGRCGRPEWSPILGPLDGSACASRDNAECRAVVRTATAIAALRSVLSTPLDIAVVRTARVVLEALVPSENIPVLSTPCPICGSAYSLRNELVRVHFAKPTDTKPCPASFRRVREGVLL